MRWLTGFSGSVGAAVVLHTRAAMFVDGRYMLQAAQQIDTSSYEILNYSIVPIYEWLGNNIEFGSRIGIDPWVHTIANVRRLREVLSAKGCELIKLENHLVDMIHKEHSVPVAKALVSVWPVSLTGTSGYDKLTVLRSELVAKQVQYAVLSDLECIAWLFNIRGTDIEFTPVVCAIALISAEIGKSYLFIDEGKLGVVREYLEQYVRLIPLASFLSALNQCVEPGAKILVDPDKVADIIGSTLEKGGGVLVESEDPLTKPKSVKTVAEINGAREAHLFDGIAMIYFLKWFDDEAASGNLDELRIVAALEEFRKRFSTFLGLAFNSIVGSGPNGAIIHYCATADSNRPIEKNSVVLVDSGAHFRSGTTDVTRTMVVGSVGDEIRDKATRVLKGHIAIATARFPMGTTGAQLDVLARMPLWQAGVNYDHGTGHGVGSCLNVHEGPCMISKTGKEPLCPGMILSNEPGYYKTGSYGIRLESLFLVTEPSVIIEGELPMCGFEVLTMVPIDKRLIKLSLMTKMELEWVNNYHARIMATLGGRIECSEVLRWLECATEPIICVT